MWNKLPQELRATFQYICGVPYTALPIATALSISHKIPMVMRRKEAKAYGTKKAIEGVWKEDSNCLVVEDLVTSGISVFETIEPLKKAGLSVSDVIVLLDREQGGRNNLEKNGVRLHAVFTITEILQQLVDDKLVEVQILEQIRKFIAENQVEAGSSEEKKVDAAAAPSPEKSAFVKLTYLERSALAKCSVAKQLFELMASKKTNLCLSIDLTKSAEILRVVDEVGPYICLLKTHADIIEDFDGSFIEGLLALAQKHNFLIFEDRKFADIGNTVTLQYSKGIHKIIEWSDITNAHCIPGEGVISGLAKCGKAFPKPRGLLLLAQMSSAGNLLTPPYVEKVWGMATASDFVAGFICQEATLGGNSKLDPAFIYMTPGVQVGSKGDALGQQYRDPDQAIFKDLCDVIIVGRGIYESPNAAQTAQSYMDLGWSAYEKRLTPQ
eukprot:TRINITY_DN4125_c0_g1_i1.p1 TRINITY_DN4125_c0_g1~~TRINITY_DN4125_c0_g1_i1.p1  ORF type:complete len:492 (-),score=144.42 TRINITY_DN4125_c0_g1_i1:54-1370(-)